MLIINNRFLSLYDYNFLLVIEKIFSVNSKICLYDEVIHLPLMTRQLTAPLWNALKVNALSIDGGIM